MRVSLPTLLRLLFSLLLGGCLAGFVLFQVSAFADSSAKLWFLVPSVLLATAALFVWQPFWRALSHVSNTQRVNIFVLWLLLAGLLFGFTTHLTPIYWRVQREHVIALCPDRPEDLSPSQQQAPVLVGMVDLVNQRDIPLQQLVGLPTVSPNLNGQSIEHCWRVRLPDTFAQEEGYLFRFDPANPGDYRVRVTINSIVEDDNAPSLRRFYDPTIHSDGKLLFSNVAIPGQIANLLELGKLLVKGLLLLVTAFTLAVALLSLGRSSKMDDTHQARWLGVAATLFIAYGLQQQIHPLLADWFQTLPDGQLWWLWLIEAQLLLLTALLMMLAYRRNPLVALANALQPLKTWQGLALMAFSTLFGTLLAYATLPFSRLFLLNEGMLVLFILAVFILSVSIARRPQTIPATTTLPQSNPWQEVMLYALPFLLVSVFYWLVFWPGLVYTDTVTQFEEIYAGVFTNHNPLLHTLLLWLLTRLWPSQGAVVLVQIVTYSLVMGLFGWRMQVHGKPRWLIWGVIALLAVYPGTALMPVNVVKGSLHGIFMIAAVLLLLEIYYSNGTWLARPRNFALLVLVVLFSAFFRHNGLIELLPVLLLGLFLWHRYARQLLTVSLSVLLLYFGGIGLAKSIVPVSRGFDGFIVQMQYVYRSYLHQGYGLAPESASYLSQLPQPFKLDMVNMYHSRRIAGLPLQELRETQYQDPTSSLYRSNTQQASLLVKDILANPLPMLRHIYYTSRTMWVPVIIPHGMSTPLPTSNTILFGTEHQELIDTYQEIHAIDSVFPVIMRWFNQRFDQHNRIDALLWRPGLYSLLLIFFASVTFIRQKGNPRLLLVWLTFLIHFSLFAVFHLWSYGYRYHWAYIAGILLLATNLLYEQKTEGNPRS